MIHVCFSLYDKKGRYSKFTGTVMLSLFENTHSEVTIHILHDNTLTQDNRNKFIELTKHYGQVLKFYNVKDLCASKIAEIRNYFPKIGEARYSIATFYRFLVTSVLMKEIEKVIYLDSDIIVNLDISELWEIELSNYPIAAVNNFHLSVIDPMKISGLLRGGFAKIDDYFNAGVLLMNLRILREDENNVLSGVKFVGEHSECNFFDQDALNYLFSTRSLKLPIKFNCLVKHMRDSGNFTVKEQIYHYAAGKYTLGLDMSDPFNRLWWSYFIKTPWFSVDSLDKILKGAQDSMLKLSDVSSSKARVFIVDEEHAYQIERSFSVSDDEEVIIVDTECEDILQKLMELMNSLRDKNIFFVGIPNIDLKLLEMGFVRGKDFFNVCGFYSPMWADLTNNYKLILEM